MNYSHHESPYYYQQPNMPYYGAPCGYGYPYYGGSSFVLIVVLFILLIIVGSAYIKY
ncbi:uncharacterized protein (TIGR01732 family) [Bacillus alveayuensis]|uniref:Uncharacterized protein (TIGR01732 family) n=1 Tax=Aeribacillus alveayuensis TaxID=279215 RepID=A0ABT9VP69_9BACI|nr:uncharacterized protein (TIGR01732 family) [Bacillus alveayuensis]